MIKKYLEFIKEEADHKHEYGCVMLGLDCPNWKEVTGMIHPDDVYHHPTDDSYGLEDNPHVTLLYPISLDVDFEDVKSVLDKAVNKKIILQIEGIDIFKNDDFDVVKFNVISDNYLLQIHQTLKENLQNDYQFKNYLPHVTISFVKSGRGDKYIKRDYYRTFEIDKITFSKKGLDSHYIINDHLL